MTTQQAADLLGVSRPTVVRLLDDVLAYREKRRSRQYGALAATAIAIATEDDPERVRRLLREARRLIAAPPNNRRRLRHGRTTL